MAKKPMVLMSREDKTQLVLGGFYERSDLTTAFHMFSALVLSALFVVVKFGKEINL